MRVAAAAAGVLVGVSASSTLLAFQKTDGCPSRIVRISAKGLDTQDLAQLNPTSNGLSESFAAAQKRAFVPAVELQESLEQHWDNFLCTDEALDELEVSLDDVLSSGQDRGSQLDLLDALIAREMEKHPESAIFVVSSHPRLLQKRQLLEPDLNEIEEALAALDVDLDAGQGYEESTESTGHQLDVELAASLSAMPALVTAFQQEDTSSVLGSSSIVSSSAIYSDLPPPSSAASSSGYSSALPTATPTLQPLPSNAPFIDRYQILTPNLLFATFLFFLILFPAGWWSISALSSIQSPFGLETKMKGVAQDKKDQ